MPTKYKRVLLKMSGEALLGDRTFGIDPAYVRYLAEEVRSVHELGVETAIVIGGGNFLRGAAVAEQGIEEATAHYMGMLAMVINALALQSQLEGTENRIAVSRQVYNDTVLTFNTTIQTVPGLLVAGPFGFSRKDFFEVEGEVREAPRVAF